VNQEGAVSSQFSNVVELQTVIRSCNASDWADARMEGPMTTLKRLRRSSIFFGGLVQSFFIGAGAIYQALIVLPLGFALVGKGSNVDPGTFVTLVQLTQGVVS